MAVWALSGLRQPPETGFDTRDFGKLPVLMNGRFQPFDSVARNSLLQIRTKQTIPAEMNGRTATLSAMDWLLEVMMKPESADDRKVFRIDNNEVTELLKVPDGQKYYSFNQLRPQLDEIEKQANRIGPIDASKRTVFESQLMKLYEMMNLYQRLEVSLKPPGSDDFAAELDAYQKSIAPGIAAVNARDAGQKFDQEAFNNLLGFMGAYNTVASFALPLTIPPADPGLPRDAWQNIGTNLMQTARTGEFNPATKFYAAMVTAYRSDQPADFNQAVAGYRAWLADRFAPQLRKAGQEFFFNTLQPFYKATVIYVLALVLACIYLLVASRMDSEIRILSGDIGCGDSHLRPRISHVSRRPAAGDQSLFLRHLHRLGLVFCWAWFWKKFIAIGIGMRGGVVRRLRHANHRAPSRAERRHHGNDARRARHEFLARHPRRHRHPRLRLDLSWRDFWQLFTFCWAVHKRLTQPLDKGGGWLDGSAAMAAPVCCPAMALRW